ncbi:MAG: CRTAC1 family protein, partial [Flavobacteriaceae bacterium]
MKRSKLFGGVFTALLILISSCKSREGFELVDAQSAGIDFENLLDQKENLTILDYLYYYNGGGVAVGDVNGDGLADIFLSANQGENKLYLNKGNWKFENVTEKSGITKKSSWNTGAVMADVNGDGHLDIYVCAVVGINGFYGFNELYINDGSGHFSEQAAQYGLDLDTYSTAASFFDYDLDGDLDVYILNHAIHTDRSFGTADLRNSRNYATGDRLLKNENGTFVDVSEEAGIFGGINGYGLGLSTADFNDDGYPDIYVGNDFHEDDYFYINNGDGTFSERLKDFFTYSTRFSMGNDIADLNGDGKLDLISLDMLPEDEFNLKSSEGDDNIQTQKMRVEDFGYHYQFTRNMLFLSEADDSYRETAILSGIAATDWSWSALFTDIDLDSKQDLFVSNGIPKRPNNLDFIRFLSNEQVQQKINNTSLVDSEALKMMPSGTVATKIFKGEKGPSFKDVSAEWVKNDISNTSATAYADFDLDGDLDFISNAIDGSPKLYKNIQETENAYLSIKLSYPSKNRLAIGAKVMLYNKGSVQTKYLNNLKGFQASSEPIIHFGLGAQSQADSLVVRWPNNTYTKEVNLQGNRHLTLEYKAEEVYIPKLNKKNYALSFEKIDPKSIGLDYSHKEDNYLDFNREKLIPYRLSDRGPAALYTDLNK